MQPTKNPLHIAISAAFLLGGSASLSAYAEEIPDTVELEAPLERDQVYGAPYDPDVPDVPEEPDNPEPPEIVEAQDYEEPQLPVTLGEIAYDKEGDAYPENYGTPGLHNAIIDKQSKTFSGYDEITGEPLYEGGTKGQQNALEHLRTNMDRKLAKQGYSKEDDYETTPLPENPYEGSGYMDAPEQRLVDEVAYGGAGDTGDSSSGGDLVGAGIVLPELTGEELSRLAHDADGNAYPEGGPKGLYGAIEGKQSKLNEKVELVVVETDDYGKTTTITKQVTNDGSNSGLMNALSKLRTNLERKLRKAGLLVEKPEALPDDYANITEAASLETRTRGNSGKLVKVETADKSRKPERATSAEKAVRTEKTARVEKVQKPEKAAKATRVERPQKPVKASSIGKPQRPERAPKPVRVSKPEKPQKPQKPGRPG